MTRVLGGVRRASAFREYRPSSMTTEQRMRITEACETVRTMGIQIYEYQTRGSPSRLISGEQASREKACVRRLVEIMWMSKQARATMKATIRRLAAQERALQRKSDEEEPVTQAQEVQT